MSQRGDDEFLFPSYRSFCDQFCLSHFKKVSVLPSSFTSKFSSFTGYEPGW